MSWINDEYQRLDRSPQALRRFGLMAGVAVLLLGGVFWWRHRGAGWPLISIGAALILSAGLAPLALKWIHGPWMIAALALGWIVTRVLLTVLFFLVITPIGLIQRLFGKRLIEIAFRSDAATYWHSRTARPVSEDYEKQF